MIDSLFQSRPSQLHLEKLFLVPASSLNLLGFLFRFILNLHLSCALLALLLGLGLQLLPQFDDFQTIPFQQDTCSPLSTGAQGFLCLLRVTDKTVLRPRCEFECVEGFCRVGVYSGCTTCGTDLYRTEDTDQRVTRQCSLKQAGQFAISVREMLSLLVGPLAFFFLPLRQPGDDSTQSQQTFVDMGTLLSPFLGLGSFLGASQVDQTEGRDSYTAWKQP